jgi:hypothetical protein
MAVNFNLLRQAGPANFYEGLVQGQEQQRVNALTQQKMAQEQQKMAQEQEINALRMQQTRGAINQQEREVKSQAVAQKTAMFRDRLLRARDPNSVRELVKMQYADPDVGAVLSQGSTLEQALAEVPDDPTQFEQYRQQEAMGMSEWMKSQMPKVTPTGDVYDPATRTFIRKPQAERAPEKTPTSADATTMQVLGFPLTPAGFTAFNNAKRMERPPAASGAGVSGGVPMGKAPSGYRYTPTGNLEPIPGGPAASKPLTETQTIKLRTDVGKDYKNASTALSQIDDLLASATSVRTAPGLSAATGFTGMLPSFSEGAAAQAETRLANLRGKVTALGKATAAMGGAIGSIANQEWKILADQIAVLNEVKGKGPLLEQIALLEEQAKGASERIRDAYEKTRADDFERFPQFRDLPAPKAPSGARVVSPNIDALLDKYLNKQK